MTFKKTLCALAATAILAIPAATATAQSGPTVGDCISDGFYGNEPNIVGPFAPGGPSEQDPGSQAGRVVPSQSPGPQVTDPSTGEVGPGNSIGDYNQMGVSIPELCRTAVESGLYTDI